MATDGPELTWSQQLGNSRLPATFNDLSVAGAAATTTIDSLLLAEMVANQTAATGLLVSEEEELKLLMFPSRSEDLSTAIPLTVIFALLLVTGCIGNLCTAIVIARPKNKYMHTATNYYLFSLAMSDFLFLTLGLPQEMFALWQRYPYVFGEFFCIIRGYLSEASTYASILTISAFTIERYVAICHPLWAHTMSQLPRAITSIVIIWMLAAICAIPPAAGLGIIKQRGPLSNRTLEQSTQCATKRVIYENMFVVSAIVFFIVPMIIVTVLYILIAIELRRSSRMNNAITKQSSGSHSTTHHQAQSATTCCRHQLNHAQSQQLLAVSCRSPNLSSTPKQPQHQQQPNQQSGSNQTDSLTLDLMSDRPASALGTERAGFLSASLAKLYPFGLSMRTLIPKNQQLQQQQQQNQMCSCCNRRAALAALHKSHSNQLTGAFEASHSPLSYHESLIQHRPHSKHHLAPSNQPHQDMEQGFGQPCKMQQMSSPATTLSGNNGGIHQHCHQSSSMRNLSTAANAGQQHHQANRPGQQLKHNNHHHHHYHHHHNHHLHNQHLNNHHNHVHKRSTGASSKKSVVRMLVAVVVSFFICWVPFHAQRLLASYLAKDENQNQLLLDIYHKLTYISGVMYYLSSTINPLLYQLMSAKFRLAFKETFKCSLFKCLQRHSNCSPSNSLKDNHASHAGLASTAHRSNHGPQHRQVTGLTNNNLSTAATHCSSSMDCCSLANQQQQQQQVPTSTYYNQLTGRLRNRLNASSFASLLRLNGTLSGNGSDRTAVECCGQCRIVDTNQLAIPVANQVGQMDASKTITNNKQSAEVATFVPPARATLKFQKSPSDQKDGLSRICSRDDEETTVVQVDNKTTTASQMEALIKPAEEFSNSEATNSPASPNVDSSPSPQSSISSNNDRANNTGQINHHQKVTLHESSTSNESRSAICARQPASQMPLRQRRRSLQQHGTTLLQKVATPAQQGKVDDNSGDRRKSSTSSATNKQHFSSSLSSSERHLDKKLSLSTTTSAIYDCGSYTTTHSQLTGCGSNGSNPAMIIRRSSGEDEEEEDEIEEEEPTTVLNSVCDNHHSRGEGDGECEEAEETDSLLASAAANSGGEPSLNKKFLDAGKRPANTKQPPCR